MFKVYVSGVYAGEASCHTSALFQGIGFLKPTVVIDYAIVNGLVNGEYCRVQVWEEASEKYLGTIEITNEDYENRL